MCSAQRDGSETRAPPHFTSSDGDGDNGRRMCEDKAKKTVDVSTADECKESVRQFMIAMHSAELADQIVFSERSKYYGNIPHGCSVNVEAKRAYFRTRAPGKTRRAHWDDWYAQPWVTSVSNGWVPGGSIPDNSCEDHTFNGRCDMSLSRGVTGSLCPPITDTADCELTYDELPTSCQSVGPHWSSYTCLCASGTPTVTSAPSIAGASACSSASFTCDEACAGISKGSGRAVVDAFNTKAACLADATTPGKVTARATCCADGFPVWWDTYKLIADPDDYDARMWRKDWEQVVAARRAQAYFAMEWMPAHAVLVATPLIVILLYAGLAFCCTKDLDYLSNVMRDDGGDEKHLDIYGYFEAVYVLC